MKLSASATLFLLFFISFTYFYPGGGHNEASRLDVIRTLIEDGSFIVDRFAYNSADLVRVNGHFYGSKAPGNTFYGLPFYWISSTFLDFTSASPQIRDHFACYWTSVFSVALPCAIGLVFLYWILLRMRNTPAEASLVTIAIGLGTLYFPFATAFFSHAVTAALFMIAFYLILSGPILAGPGRSSRPLIAGFCLGSAVIFEYPAAIGSGLIGLYAIWKNRTSPRTIALLLLAGVLGLLPAFIQNYLAFGNPFYLSYEAYADSAAPTFAAHKKGFLGIRVPLTNPDDWKLFLKNLAEITYRPLRGLFFLNPVLILVFPGFFILLRRVWMKTYPFASEVILALAIFIGYFVMNAGYGDSIVYWGGGASFGPRHIIPMLPFAALALAATLQVKSLRAVFAPLMAISVFFCLMATAIEPRTPYAPANPLFQFYLPKYLDADFAITKVGIFSERFLTPNSVAFNWAKLFGFPGPLQLLPLLLFWVLAARELDRTMGTAGRGFTYATGVFVLTVGLLPLAASW